MDKLQFFQLKLKIKSCASFSELKQLAILSYREKCTVILYEIDEINLQALTQLFIKIWAQMHPQKKLL